jgi:uncharacterized protein (TIGR03067 family)
MRLLSLLTCAALTLAFAPAPLPRPQRHPTDLERLQGTWEIRVHDQGGQRSNWAGWKIVVAGSRLRIAGEGRASHWTVSLAGRQKVLLVRGLAEDSPVEEWLYSIEGDTLTICYRYGDGGKDRPEALAPSPGRVFRVLRRVRP